jgi:hypothetical protein
MSFIPPRMFLALMDLPPAILLFAIAWVVLGVIAFIHSIVCMGRTPSISRALAGMLMAIFLGPLFWVYWYLDGEYCRGSSG